MLGSSKERDLGIGMLNYGLVREDTAAAVMRKSAAKVFLLLISSDFFNFYLFVQISSPAQLDPLEVDRKGWYFHPRDTCEVWAGEDREKD